MDVSSRATQEAKAEERKLTPLWGEYSWGMACSTLMGTPFQAIITQLIRFIKSNRTPFPCMLFAVVHLLLDSIFILNRYGLISYKRLLFSENPISGTTSSVRYFTSSCRHCGIIRVISFR
jgi:hypothetical protein